MCICEIMASIHEWQKTAEICESDDRKVEQAGKRGKTVYWEERAPIK